VEPPQQSANSDLMSTRKPARQIQHAGAETHALAATGRSVDQQATRRAETVSGATVNPGRLNGNPGVTTYLKLGESEMPSTKI